MKKKVYKAPQAELIVLMPFHMLATSIGVGTDKVDAGQSFANEKRGTWGNLWSDR